MKTTTLLAIIFLFLFANVSVAQEKYDTLPADYKKNIVKWNMTPYFLWGSPNFNFSYERVLQPYRSFSINAGYFVLPNLLGYNSLNFTNTRKKSGYSFSGDYRLYFKNRNTRNAPDGLYWGPYGSIHHYQFQNDVEVKDSQSVHSSFGLDGKINIMSMGLELGYQFLIKDKFTIDLIFMGPSVSIYSGTLLLDGELTADDEAEYLQEIRDALISKYPFLEDLISQGKFSKKGTSTSFGYGLRYIIQVGYRF